MRAAASSEVPQWLIAESLPPPKVIAVTGGAGFLGSHLCELLHRQGHHIVCIDNFSTGRLENIEFLLSSGRFDLTEHDVTNPWPQDLPRFDEIYNLACPASPSRYQSDRVKTALTCAFGAFHALERAARDGAKVLHASTSEIYGDPDVHPQTEYYFGNVNTVGPRSCYDEGKRFAETLATDFAAQNGISVKIVRIFNTYGPRMSVDDGRVVSNFVVQALQGKDLTVYGDGSQTRSFCYVDDMVDGFVRLMESDGKVNGPVNLGNPNEINVAELGRLIIDMTGSSSRIVHHPLPVDDPRRRRPDITRAMQALNWRPVTSLHEGLHETIRYFATHSALIGQSLDRIVHRLGRVKVGEQ